MQNLRMYFKARYLKNVCTAVLGLFIAGCITSEAMLDREPILEVESKFLVSAVRDCIFRWADNPGLRLQYHPDGVWIRDPFGAAVALVAQSDGVARLYHHWNAAPAKKHLVFLTETCVQDPSERPPSNFWRTTPQRRGDS